MRRRRRKRKKSWLLNQIGRFFKQRWVRRGLLVLLLLLSGVNLAVSHLGQCDAFFLSPFHLWDKTRALGFYTAHQASRIWNPPAPPARNAILQAAKRHRVPVKLALAIARAESDFIPYRISRTGAMGLMQIMPDTASDLGIRDPFHAGQNADGGVRYIARLWQRYRGDLRRVAAAYNAGPGRVPRSGPYQVPPETRAYVNKVLRYARLN